MLVLVSLGDLLSIIKKSNGSLITVGGTDLSVVHGCMCVQCFPYIVFTWEARPGR